MIINVKVIRAIISGAIQSEIMPLVNRSLAEINKGLTGLKTPIKENGNEVGIGYTTGVTKKANCTRIGSEEATSAYKRPIGVSNVPNAKPNSMSKKMNGIDKRIPQVRETPKTTRVRTIIANFTNALNETI